MNLHGYTAEVPAVDAVPGNPGQPYIAPTYEMVVVTPAIPEIPAVPATYVQEWLYVQKNHPNQTKWEHEGWNGIVHGNDHGLGWHYVVPEQHRDTTEVLTPAIPAVPAVPAVTMQVMTNPGQPYIAPTPGTPAAPAKANTVKLTIDDVSVIDTTFGANFTSTQIVDPTTSHHLHLLVTGWDGTGNLDQVEETEACVGPINVITLPQPVVTQPTGVCDDGEFVITAGSVKLILGEQYAWGNYGQDEHGVIHNVTPGTHTYTATPVWGVALDQASVTATVETLVSNECEPTSEPTPTETPTPTPTKTVAPTPAPTEPVSLAPTVTKTVAVIPQGTITTTQAVAPKNQWVADLAAHGDNSASAGESLMGSIATVVAVVLLVGLALVLSRTRRRRPRH